MFEAVTESNASLTDAPHSETLTANVSELVEVRESDIHGRGLFARAFIAQGTLIGQIIGTPTTTDGPHVLWISEDHGIRVLNDLRFINHSGQANAAYFDDGEVVALCDIQPGEEIVHDYNGDGEAWDSEYAEEDFV